MAADSPTVIPGTTIAASPKPLLLKSGMEIGGGKVYPELNFTLPPMDIETTPKEKILGHYRQIVAGAFNRAAELESDGVVLEFETLLPMTWMSPKGVQSGRSCSLTWIRVGSFSSTKPGQKRTWCVYGDVLRKELGW